MFIQTDNYLHGIFVYAPNGRSARAGMALCERCDRCILHLGENVTVQSLWFRNAYPGDPMLLAYVRGEHTGEHTHVPAGELVKYLS